MSSGINHGVVGCFCGERVATPCTTRSARKITSQRSGVAFSPQRLSTTLPSRQSSTNKRRLPPSVDRVDRRTFLTSRAHNEDIACMCRGHFKVMPEHRGLSTRTLCLSLRGCLCRHLQRFLFQTAAIHVRQRSIFSERRVDVQRPISDSSDDARACGNC